MKVWSVSNENKTNEREPEDLFESVTICSNTAKCFLRELDETHGRWENAKWVFRGQNNATWKLIPSLFRIWDESKPVSYELDMIDSFIQFSNVVKLDIPSNTLDYVSRTGSKNTVRSFVPGVSYDFSHIVFAIAQHYGVPTRLLDFSHSPLVAAYFAADVTNLISDLGWSLQTQSSFLNRCLENINDFAMVRRILSDCISHLNGVKEKLPTKIAVWAIDTYKIEKDTSLHLLTHPYGQIRYLREQLGVFLCETKLQEGEGEQGCCWQSFDKELSKLVASKGVYKLTLPIEHVDELRYLLGKMRIHEMFLKPSFTDIGSRIRRAFVENQRYPRQWVQE